MCDCTDSGMDSKTCHGADGKIEIGVATQCSGIDGTVFVSVCHDFHE